TGGFSSDPVDRAVITILITDPEPLPVPAALRPALCLEPPYTGPCRALFIRYFYNAKSGLCETFVYDGNTEATTLHTRVSWSLLRVPAAEGSEAAAFIILKKETHQRSSGLKVVEILLVQLPTIDAEADRMLATLRRCPFTGLEERNNRDFHPVGREHMTMKGNEKTGTKFHFSTGKTESPVLTVKERLHQPTFLDTPQEDERKTLHFNGAKGKRAALQVFIAVEICFAQVWGFSTTELRQEDDPTGGHGTFLQSLPHILRLSLVLCGLNSGQDVADFVIRTAAHWKREGHLKNTEKYEEKDLPIEQTGRDWVFLGLAEIRGQWRGQTKEAIIGTLDKEGMNKLMERFVLEASQRGQKHHNLTETHGTYSSERYNRAENQREATGWRNGWYMVMRLRINWHGMAMGLAHGFMAKEEANADSAMIWVSKMSSPACRESQISTDLFSTNPQPHGCGFILISKVCPIPLLVAVYVITDPECLIKKLKEGIWNMFPQYVQQHVIQGSTDSSTIQRNIMSKGVQHFMLLTIYV
ncbi:hypothetical protein E2I00_009631, partial [Balaenoptera physalus]